MKDFRTLKVWQKAHALTLEIYKAAEKFPKQEMYAATNQIQRAAVSIPANIAERCGKDGDAELGRYFRIAIGSSSELEYLLILAHHLGYLFDDNYQGLLSDLSNFKKCSTSSFNG